MKFETFSEAIVQLSPMKIGEAEAAVEIIKQGQRFYFPPGTSIVNFDDLERFGISTDMRLPFPQIAILSGGEYYDHAGECVGRIETITCVTECGPGSFAVIGISREVGTRAWVVAPAVNVLLVDGRVGCRHFQTPFLLDLISRGVSESKLRDDAICDGTILFNLLSLMRLQNVATDHVAPSGKVNAKRKSRGKLPLYSYKVLVVDGERWDTPGVATNTSDGYRSHLRRGHIRRLADDRCVWVRAAFVHGRQAGFVAKDYDVRSPA